MGDTRLTPTGVRLPEELRTYYAELAKREHRSLSGQIIVALEEWRAQRERQGQEGGLRTERQKNESPSVSGAGAFRGRSTNRGLQT